MGDKYAVIGRVDECKELVRRCKMEFDKVAGGGKVTTSATGAQWDPTGGKSLRIADMLSWLPVEALGRVTRHYQNGAKKYAKDNWRKGVSADVCLDKAFRHLYQYQQGDRSEDHLSAVVFWMFCLLVWEETDRTDLFVGITRPMTPEECPTSECIADRTCRHPFVADVAPAVGSWEWACRQMDAGKTVRCVFDGTTRLVDSGTTFVRDPHKMVYLYRHGPVVADAISSWGDSTFEYAVVEDPS